MGAQALQGRQLTDDGASRIPVAIRRELFAVMNLDTIRNATIIALGGMALLWLLMQIT
jgi:hypothetical protein